MRNNTPDIDEIHSCYSCYDCSKKDRIQCGEKNKLEQLIAKERLEARIDGIETSYGLTVDDYNDHIAELKSQLNKLNNQPTENNLSTVDERGR